MVENVLMCYQLGELSVFSGRFRTVIWQLLIRKRNLDAQTSGRQVDEVTEEAAGGYCHDMVLVVGD